MKFFWSLQRILQTHPGKPLQHQGSPVKARNWLCHHVCMDIQSDSLREPGADFRDAKLLYWRVAESAVRLQTAAAAKFATLISRSGPTGSASGSGRCRDLTERDHSK